ncbi:MAG: hypothetical protein LBP26_00460, partial [Clostridiales bacterium]|nr:hypothetical protein [Clostridiales bacterium]
MSAGGGGSGYIGGVVNGATSIGQRAGNGYVTISRYAAIRLAATTPTKEGGRATPSITLPLAEIATEAVSGATLNYTNAANGEAMTNGAIPLYLDQACTQSADNYATATASGTDLLITPKITLTEQTFYVLVRNSSPLFTLGAPFKITTTNTAWVTPATADFKTNDAGVYNASGTQVGKYGLSAITAPGAGTPDTWAIYNPGGENIRTLFVYRPIGLTKSLTIPATFFATDADTAADRVAFRLNNHNMNGVTAYTVDYTGEVTTDHYSNIVIKPLSVINTNYLRLSLTVRNFENNVDPTLDTENGYYGRNEFATMSVDIVFRLDNTRPYFAGMNDNLTTNMAEPHAVVTTGGTAKIYLSNIAKDPDANGNSIPDHATAGTIVLPTHEYVSVDKYGVAVAMKSGSAYGGYVSRVDADTSAGTVKTAMATKTDANKTGFSPDLLLNRNETDPNLDNRDFAVASVTTGHDTTGYYVQVEGLRASVDSYVGRKKNNASAYEKRLGHFYILVRVVDEGESEDAGIYYPVAITVKPAAPVKTAAARIAAGAGTRGAEFIFSPYAVKLDSDSEPRAVGSMNSDALNVKNNGYHGRYLNDSGAPVTTAAGRIKYLATDADTYIYTRETAITYMGWGNTTGEYGAEKNHITLPQNDPTFIRESDNNRNMVLLDRSTDSNFGEFFDVQFIDLFMPATAYKYLPNYQALKAEGYITEVNADVVKIKGIKVTVLRNTLGNYIEFDVEMISSRAVGLNATGDVPEAHPSVTSQRDAAAQPTSQAQIKGENNDFGYKTNTATIGSFIQSPESGNLKVVDTHGTYSLEVRRNQTVYITPYDILEDGDTVAAPAGSTNPGNNLASPRADFDEFQKKTNATSVVRVTGSAGGTATVKTDMRLDRLHFGHIGDTANNHTELVIATSTINGKTDGTGGLPGVEGGRQIDFIAVTGLSKSNITAEIQLVAYDSYGNSHAVTLRVKVINSAPALSTMVKARLAKEMVTDNGIDSQPRPAGAFYLRATPESGTSSDYENPASYDGTNEKTHFNNNMYNVREFAPFELLTDNDPDDVQMSRLRVVNNSFKYLTKTAADGEFVELNGRYIEASIENGTGKRNSISEVLRVRGLSSTQGLKYGLWLQFTATDGATAAELRIPFEVIETAPAVNTRALEPAEDGDANEYKWTIEFTDATENSARYYVSSEAMGQMILRSLDLPANTTGVYYVIAAEADANQRPVPVTFGSDKTALPLAQSGWINSAAIASSANGFKNGTTNATGGKGVAVWMSNPLPDENGGPAEFVKGGKPYLSLTYYDAAKVAAPGTDFSTPDIQIDNTQLSGEWKDVLKYEWAIAVDMTRGGTNPVVHMSFVSSDRAATAKDGDGNPVNADIGTEGGFGNLYTGGRPVAAVKNNDVLTVSVAMKKLPRNLINNFEREIDTVNNRTYPTYSITPTADGDPDKGKTLFSAFEYKPLVIGPTPIKVPLSYFASVPSSPKNPADATSSIGYPRYESAGYPTVFNNPPDLKHENAMLNALSISDGYHTWTGATGQYQFKNNPYIKVELAKRNDNLADSSNIYYNKNRYVLAEGKAELAGGTYVEDAAGIVITKKSARTSGNVTFSIKLRPWNGLGGPGATDEADTLNYGLDGYAAEARDLTVYAPIVVQNARVSLTNDPTAFTSDLTTTAGSRNSYIYLQSKGINEQPIAPAGTSSYNDNAAANVTIAVSDDDNVNRHIKTGANTGYESNHGYTEADLLRYRDKAAFSVKSLYMGDAVKGYTQNELDKLHAIALTANTSKIEDLFGDAFTDSDKGPFIAATVLNPGFENFFAVEPNRDSGMLTLIPKRKTALDMGWLNAYRTANPALFTGATGNTPEELDKAAQKFNLRYDAVKGAKTVSGVTEYTDAGFYYELKLLAYDYFGGSDFTDGTVDAVRIRVFINNNPMKINNMAIDSVQKGDLPANYKTVSLSLPVGSVDRSVTGFVTDTDMEFVSDTSSDYKTAAALAPASWAGVSYADALKVLTKDYIGDIEDVTAAGDKKPNLAEITWDAANANLTINVKTRDLSVPKGTPSLIIDIAFRDNHKTGAGAANYDCVIRFKIEILNSAPVIAPDVALASLENQTITMRAGDSFTLFATSYAEFAKGESASPASTTWSDWQTRNNDTNSNSNKIGAPTLPGGAQYSDADVGNAPASAFVKDATASAFAASGKTHLGYLSVFKDETPWALRFSSGTSGNNELVACDAYLSIRREGNESIELMAPVAFVFTAKGPAESLPISVSVYDESTSSTASFTMFVTVKSTLPTALTPGDDEFDREDVEYIQNSSLESSKNVYTYRAYVKVGQAVDFEVKDFAKDRDAGGNDKMQIKQNGGVSFRYVTDAWNGDNLSAQSANNAAGLISVTRAGTTPGFKVRGVNFAAGTDSNRAVNTVTRVAFEVMDGDGAVPDAAANQRNIVVVLEVMVIASDIELTATGSNTVTAEVKSLYDYLDNGGASAFNTVRAASDNTTAAVFKDNDFGAQNAKYSVKIYTMRGESNGTVIDTDYKFTTLPADRKQAFLAVNFDPSKAASAAATVSAGGGSNAGASALFGKGTNANIDGLADYIDPESLAFSPDGTVIRFVPKMATLDGAVPLYAEVSKAVYAEYGSNNPEADGYTLIESAFGGHRTVDKAVKATSFKLRVANSAPTATANTNSNKIGDADFLTFNAYRGDTRTYVVYNQDAVDDKILFGDLDKKDVLTINAEKSGVRKIGDQLQIYKMSGTKVYEGFGDAALYSLDKGSVFTAEPGVGPDGVPTLEFEVLRNVEYTGTNAELKKKPTYVEYEIFVTDKGGNEASTVVTLVINNSKPSFKVPAANTLPANAVMTQSGGIFELVITLEAGKPDTLIKLTDIYGDRDYVPTIASISDTARFVSAGAMDYRDVFPSLDPVGAGGEPTRKPSMTAEITDMEHGLLFTVTSPERSNARLIFRAVPDNFNRGATVTLPVKIEDAYGEVSALLKIKLVTANTAPVSKNAANNVIYIMGNAAAPKRDDDTPGGPATGSGSGKEDSANLDTFEYDVYDYIFDPNGGDMDYGKGETYIRDHGAVAKDPTVKKIYGPNYGKDGNTQLFDVIVADDSENGALKIRITPFAGIYGYQKISIKLTDGVYSVGDTKEYSLDIMVYITKNPADVEIQLIELAYMKSVEITADLLFLNKQTGENEGEGFAVQSVSFAGVEQGAKIVKIEPDASVKNAAAVGAARWFVQSLSESGTTVEFFADITVIGGEANTAVRRTFAIKSIDNLKPVLTGRYALSSVLLSKEELTNGSTYRIPVNSGESGNNMVIDPENDKITLLNVKSSKSVIVDATIDQNAQAVVLNFKSKG